MLVALDRHHTHGGDRLWDAFREAMKTAILLERDFNLRVVGNELILSFHV